MAHENSTSQLRVGQYHFNGRAKRILTIQPSELQKRDGRKSKRRSLTRFGAKGAPIPVQDDSSVIRFFESASTTEIPTLSGFASLRNVTPVDSEGPFPDSGKASLPRIPNATSAAFRSSGADARNSREQR
jgi:hypothetical protein